MPVRKGPECVGEEMGRFKKGELHSGKSGKVVTDPTQAKAIALSACGRSRYSEVLKSLGYSEEAAESAAEMFAESFAKASKKSSSVSSFEEMDWKKNFETGKAPAPENKANYKTGQKDAELPLAGNRNKDTEDEQKLPGGSFAEGQNNPHAGKCGQKKLREQAAKPRTPAQEAADQERSRNQKGKTMGGNRSEAAKKAAETRAKCKGQRNTPNPTTTV
jgi:hypothetical protein